MISGTQQRMKLILSVLLTFSLSLRSHVACFQYSSGSLVRNKRVTPIAHSSFHKTLLFAADSDSAATLNIIIADGATVDSSKSLSSEVILKNERSISDEEQNEISNRMILTIMALIFVVTSLSALDRVAMSVALVPLSQEMGYTDTMKGSISSFFSVGYGLGILPSGLLLAYISPRKAMAAGVACWSLATIATPYAADQSTMGLLLFVRAIVGGAESIVLPSVQRLLSNWVPSDKKSLAVATVFAGFQSGTILAYTLSPVVLDINMFDTTWRGLFYVYGGIGLLYLIPWLALAKDQPGAMPGVVETQQNQQTASKILTDGGRGITDTPPTASAWENAKEVLISAPWKEFAQSKAVWAMILAHAANNWGLYNNLSWSPTFYAEQYGLNVRESAILLVVPSLAGMVGGLSAGALADAAIRKFAPATDETITNIRKAFQGVALFGPALCLATMAWHVPDEPWVAQSLLTGTVGLQAFNSAGYGAANQEKAGEKWTGLLYGITSLPAVMLGTFGVYLTGQILDFTNQDWSYVFGLNAFMNVLGATAFVALYDSKKEFD